MTNQRIWGYPLFGTNQWYQREWNQDSHGPTSVAVNGKPSLWYVYIYYVYIYYVYIYMYMYVYTVQWFQRFLQGGIVRQIVRGLKHPVYPSMRIRRRHDSRHPWATPHRANIRSRHLQPDCSWVLRDSNWIKSNPTVHIYIHLYIYIQIYIYIHTKSVHYALVYGYAWKWDTPKSHGVSLFSPLYN